MGKFSGASIKEVHHLERKAERRERKYYNYEGGCLHHLDRATEKINNLRYHLRREKRYKEGMEEWEKIQSELHSVKKQLKEARTHMENGEHLANKVEEELKYIEELTKSEEIKELTERENYIVEEGQSVIGNMKTVKENLNDVIDRFKNVKAGSMEELTIIQTKFEEELKEIEGNLINITSFIRKLMKQSRSVYVGIKHERKHT